MDENEMVTIADDLARTLAETRQELDAVKASKKHAEELLASTFLGKQLADAITYIKELAGAEDAQKKDLAGALGRLAPDIESGAIGRHGAIHQIRHPITLTYDTRQAINYCIERHPEFLLLDVKAFENFVKKSGADLTSFVTSEESVEVIVKGDLSEFLR